MYKYLDIYSDIIYSGEPHFNSNSNVYYVGNMLISKISSI